MPLPVSRAASRPRRRTFWLFLALVLGLLTVAAGCSTGTPYVSLGDSYVSGPLVPNQTLNPVGCLRSDHNYPHLSALALALSLNDVSCSGATTANMAGPQAVTLGTNPPQLNALNSGTKVVTLGIGGNDIGFVSVIENCVAASPYGPTKVGLTCKSHYAPAGGTDQLAAAINATAPKVDAVLSQIHARATQAKVFVVGYPAILPDTGSCYPQMPLTTTDVGYLRGVEQGLNTMLKGRAAAHAATYVDTYSPSAPFNACTSPLTRWVEPLAPVNPAAPVHPNVRGEAGMASAVEKAMKAQGVS